MTEKTKAAAYVRRSTKDQAQSLERQRHEIERFAAANAIEVVRWYEDDGVSGVEDALRPGFQRMVADAERQRDFDVILVHEISRFGRFDAHQSGSWLHRLKAARVRVQAIEGTVKDPYSIQGKLMLALEQDRQESVKLSMRTLSGQRETATKGFRAGGKVPYGYTRKRHRADGSVEIVGRVGRAKRDRSEVIELVPGDPIEVEAVRSIFTWALEGCGYRTVAARLNDRGIPSPDVARKTIATTPGRWVATTIRALLLNPAYVGDAIWNVRSMPKFHRLEGDQIVALDDFDGDQHWRKNARIDWVVKRDAHPPLIERRVFEAVHQRLRARPAMPRGHRHDYLLTGSMSCSCGDVMTGMTRIRRKVVDGKPKVYEDPIYVCAGGLRAKGICRQIGLPCAGMERAVLRILDEEVFSPEGLALLEQAIRREMAQRGVSARPNAVAALEKRERELAQTVTDGARRLLQVDEEVVTEVRAALGDLKGELERVRKALMEERSTTHVPKDPDDVVEATLGPIRSMATLLRDPATSLDRRREILRRLLPAGPNGERPIRVEFDLNSGRGWRRAMRRATVRHLTIRAAKVTNVVAGAVAAEGELRECEEEFDFVEALACGERDIRPEHVFEVEVDGPVTYAGVENESELVAI